MIENYQQTKRAPFVLGTLVKYQLTVCVWTYLWAFYFVPLVLCLSLYQYPHCFDYCSFAMCFEIRNYESWGGKEIACGQQLVEPGLSPAVAPMSLLLATLPSGLSILRI